jgi:hypothetical protein
MAVVREKHFDELRRRMRLPLGNPQHISRAELQAAMDGAFMQSHPTMSVRFGTRFLVEALIKADYHQAAGVTEKDYRKLWPVCVEQPPEYAGRFDAVLLVDRSIPLSELMRCGDIYPWVNPTVCTDLNLADAPQHPETKAALKRYVAFVQLGAKNLSRSVEDCRKAFTADEVGLVTVEGLHLPVQHERHLRHWAVDLASSRCSEVGVPCVGWFADTPDFYAGGVQHADPVYGSGSRGRQVIPVSW